jgi:putative transposase
MLDEADSVPLNRKNRILLWSGKSALITYKFRLYPTNAQLKLMSETLETCRLLYNELLAIKIDKRVDFFTLKRSLVQRKAGNKYLSSINAQVLQDVNLRLDKAFERFVTGLSRHPKFKRMGRYKSFTYPQLGGFRIIDGKLRLSKIGLVRIVTHRPITGGPKTCTIVRDVNQWYACITADDGISENSQLCSNYASVGVDLGIENIATQQRQDIRESQKSWSFCN